MTHKPVVPQQPGSEEALLRAREEQERMAGNPTAAAERKPDEVVREEMSAEEKLQARTDELMRRIP